jgi:hypothetical protein
MTMAELKMWLGEADYVMTAAAGEYGRADRAMAERAAARIAREIARREAECANQCEEDVT